MDPLRLASWILVVWSALIVVAGPFAIGKTIKKTGLNFLFILARSGLTIFLAGHFIGWW